MATSIVKFRITGISPILMNNPASMGSGNARPGGIGGPKRPPNPEDEAKIRLYKLKSGQLYIPTNMFRASMLKACTNRRVGKLAAKGVFSGACFDVGTEAPLVDPKTRKAIKTYKLHTTRAVIVGQGVMRTRPMVKEWSCDVGFDIDHDFLPDVSVVLDMLNIAGRTIGVLDWRPQKTGSFGRYQVKMIS